MTKANAQLQEELSAAKAELADVSEELADIKKSARDQLTEEKALLRLQARANEAIRDSELSVATEGYEALFEKAQKIYEEQIFIDPALLGTPGKCAREGILSVLKEIFGEL